jgi:hypothetical protein
MAPCVVLAPEHQTMDERLPRLLSDRGWAPRLEHDPRMAMAELGLIRRELRVDCAWDESPASWPGLVVVNSRGLPQWESMLHAMERHLPDISIWGWDGLNLVCIHDATPDEPAATEDTASESSPAPSSSLPFRPEPLSHDEVSMLLHGRTDTEST